jgi:hydrogenase nickel incorporation protein HypA/HybF
MGQFMDGRRRGAVGHETGLCEAIVATALRCAAGRRVVGVRVRIGGHPLNPRVVHEDFRLASAGTPAAGAAIDLVIEPLASRCRACGFVTPATDPLAMVACTRCESLDIEAVGDDRPVLESISFARPTDDHAKLRDRAVKAGRWARRMAHRRPTRARNRPRSRG